MRKAKSETIVFLAERSRAGSRSGELSGAPGITEGRTQLMRLHDRLKGPVDALGARLDPSTRDPEPLDEFTED